MTKQHTRSICVKTWEAKALHDGRLSVLLRPVKLDLGHHEYVEVNSDDPSNLVREYHYGGVTRSTYVECPFGIVGDELACKESYARRDDFDWRADKEKTLHYLRLKSQYEGDLGNEWHWYGDWRPASTMTLWMCRLHRTIASVRIVKPCELTRSEIAATAANAWLESLDGRAYDNAEKAAYRHTKSINPDATAVERCGILRACLDSTWGEGLWDREFWAIGFKEVEK